jgi:hypothetical protein
MIMMIVIIKGERLIFFQVRNAQRASYSAVIVYNKDSDKVIPMGGDDSTLIPSVFIG